MKQIKKIVEHNFVVFMYEVQQHIQDGYHLDTDFVPGYYGYHYEAEMSKGEDEKPIEVTPEQQEEINNALDKADAEDAQKNDKPAAKPRGRKSQASKE